MLPFLIIGGNNFSGNTQPRILAGEVENLARRIEESTGSHCVIICLEKLSDPRGITVEQYDKI